MNEKDDRLVLRDAISRGLKQRRQKMWEDAVKRAIVRHGEGNAEQGLDNIADSLIKLAALGERWAVEEIGNRLDGKPAQAIQHTGEDGGPIKLSWPLPKSPREE